MYEESWIEKHGTKIIIGCLTTFIIIMTTLMYLSFQRSSYLYDQCLKDGKKEYECYSILYRGSR